LLKKKKKKKREKRCYVCELRKASLSWSIKHTISRMYIKQKKTKKNKKEGETLFFVSFRKLKACVS